MRLVSVALLLAVLPRFAPAQSPAIWSGYGNNPQHTALSTVAAQPLNRIHWQTPVDLSPQITGGDILIHYGSPLVTAANTIIIPVKTGPAGGFRVEARSGSDGSLKYVLATDYILPPHNWTPSYGPVLTSANRLYWAGAGGTVYYRDQPDLDAGPTGQIAFYGNSSYSSFAPAFNASVMVSTPLIGDREGNIFFGFTVSGVNPLNLTGGIARIDVNGTGTFVTAAQAAGDDPAITRVPLNATPTLSNDQRRLYFGVAGNNYGTAYLVAVDSGTLAAVARIALRDPRAAKPALLVDDGTASPMVGPDGDVYYGVLEDPVGSNHQRGWLLHFNAALTQIRIAGAFGWDDTPSLVPSSLVPSYAGSSKYLILTKYNNYGDTGGDGVNRIAVLDPNAASYEPISGALVMAEVLTVAGITPDPAFRPSLPNAVREWCINSAAIDPFQKAAMVNSEDGSLYRWDLSSNTLSQSIALTGGTGEAYTPTVIGADGTVYAINHAILFAVGQ